MNKYEFLPSDVDEVWKAVVANLLPNRSKTAYTSSMRMDETVCERSFLAIFRTQRKYSKP